MVRSLFQSFFKFNWPQGLALILIFGIPRFLLVMQANMTGRFNLVSIVFLIMCLMPWLLLSREGRHLIGIRKPEKGSWIPAAFILGAAACVLVFFIGKWLFFDTTNNWFIYLAKSYEGPAARMQGESRILLFLIFALIGISFSPIGEELLYRGLIHQCFVGKYGDHGASLVDSAAFAVTHLAHFGLVYIAGGWQFLWLPAIFWLIFMFLVSRLFHAMIMKTGSILGAIVSHAGFNLAMTYLIVYHILP